MNRQKKPPRPLGLTLALLGSTLVFSIIPLFVIGTLVYLNNRVYSPEEGSYIGFEMPGLNYEPLFVYGLTAVFFIIMAVIAWKRRHPLIRVLFPLLTLLYGVLTLAAVTGSGASASLENGIDSTMEFQSSVTGFYLAVVVGTVLYVVWFMNRWSARAYYRGYYTPADKTLLDETYGPSASPAQN